MTLTKQGGAFQLVESELLFQYIRIISRLVLFRPGSRGLALSRSSAWSRTDGFTVADKQTHQIYFATYGNYHMYVNLPKTPT